jgi:hypothetical protein
MRDSVSNLVYCERFAPDCRLKYAAMLIHAQCLDRTQTLKMKY